MIVDMPHHAGNRSDHYVAEKASNIDSIEIMDEL